MSDEKAPVVNITADEAIVSAPGTVGFMATTHENTQEIEWTDETITTGEFEVYKGRKNVTDRIAILTKPTLGRFHYKQGVGFFLCNSKYTVQGGVEMCENPALCCQLMNEPAKKRFAALILQYDTRPNGELTQPFGFKLLVWRFREDKFVALRGIAKEWPFEQHDLMVSCSDEGYQKMSFNVCKSTVITNDVFKANFGVTVEAWTKTMRPKLERAIGRPMTDAQIAEAFGKAGLGGQVSQSQTHRVSESPIAEIGALLNS
jgi:hypothetical protein